MAKWEKPLRCTPNTRQRHSAVAMGTHVLYHSVSTCSSLRPSVNPSFYKLNFEVSCSIGTLPPDTSPHPSFVRFVAPPLCQAPCPVRKAGRSPWTEPQDPEVRRASVSLAPCRGWAGQLVEAAAEVRDVILLEIPCPLSLPLKPALRVSSGFS